MDEKYPKKKPVINICSSTYAPSFVSQVAMPPHHEMYSGGPPAPEMGGEPRGAMSGMSQPSHEEMMFSGGGGSSGDNPKMPTDGQAASQGRPPK